MNKEYYSNCCNAFMGPYYEDTLICPECKEHCGKTIDCDECHAMGNIDLWIKERESMQIILIAILLHSTAFADNRLIISDEKLCEAIHKAEGNDNYGILAHYKHTSYRQACLNTIRHSRQRYVATHQKGDFIVFLSKTYCPIGASNDPNGLNKNWVKNVKYFLIRG